MLAQGLLVLFAITVFCAPGRAEPRVLLDQGFREMYNLEFAEAHQTFHEYQRENPDDPLGPVSDAAAYLFSEFDRLHILQSEFFVHDQHFVTDHKLTADPLVKQQFEAALETSRKLSERAPGDQNSVFASILRTGLRSDYLGLIEKRYVGSFQELKTARTMAERLIASDPKFYDAWLAVGVENYMLSVKPAPIRWILRLGGAQTDRALGIEKLRLVAEKGHYLAPFARLLLAVAALREGDKDSARELLRGLVKEFPRNRLYAQELTQLEAVGRVRQ